MKHDREFWTRHVERWRASGLTQKAYCARRRLAKGSLGYWASTLERRKAAVTELVEVGRTEVKPQQSNCPIELAVQGGYLLRLWPGVQPAHLREVLSVLERRS
jgi:hypothetical protein